MEVKVRAWDRTCKQFVSGGYWLVNGLPAGEIKHIPDVDVTLFTGRHDSKKVEIYVGDRVHYAGYTGTVVYDEDYCTFKVKVDGRQVVKNQPLTKGNEPQITVIGHIWEERQRRRVNDLPQV